MANDFLLLPLDDAHSILKGTLPERLSVLGREKFEDLWALHPPAFHEMKLAGKTVHTKRWQQAYGADYRYSGTVNRALPVPPLLEPFRDWVKESIDNRLNGILLNWYDGTLSHTIGKHRDSTADMIEGAPIVTISLGEERVFRLRPWGKPGSPTDVPVPGGTVIVMPYATNLAWTHEVPHAARFQGKRISITLRAFVV